MFQSKGGVQYAREDTHRGKTPRVSALREIVFSENAVETALEDPHGGKTVQLCGLSKGLCGQVEHDVAHEAALWDQTLFLHRLL